jgi:tetratricopeptide (TPR) repeat protein
MAQTLRRPLTLLCTTFLLAALLCAALHAAEEPPPKRPTAVQIVRAAEALGSHDRTKRVAAEALLKRAGPAALVALSEAAQSPDRIAAARAEIIIDRIRLGVHPDTPEDVATLAGSFTDASEEVQILILASLAKRGKHGLKATRSIAMMHGNIPSLEKAAANWRDRVQAYIRQCKFTEAEALLWIATVVTPAEPVTANRDFHFANQAPPGDMPPAMMALLGPLPAPPPYPNHSHPDLAAFLAVRGRLDEAICEVTGWEALGESGQRRRLLAHLLKAAGRYREAESAVRTDARGLFWELLFLEGNWSVLGRQLMAEAAAAPLHAANDLWSDAATCAYLAGDDKQLDSALRQWRTAAHVESAGGKAKTRLPEEFTHTLAAVERGGTLLTRFRYPSAAHRALLDMGRAADAEKFDPLIIQRIIDTRNTGCDPIDKNTPCLPVGTMLKRAEFHLQRGRYAEARKLILQAEKAATSAAHYRGYIESVARLQYAVGMIDEARALLKQSPSSTDSDYLILKEEVRGAPAEALAWRKFIRQRYPDVPEALALKRTKDIVTGKSSKKELAAQVLLFLPTIKQIVEADGRRAAVQGVRFTPAVLEAHHLAALARTCARNGLFELAVQCLKRSGNITKDLGARVHTAHTRQLATVLFEAARWRESADVFARVMTAPQYVTARDLFMYGVAKLHSGQKAEGERLIEAARLLPLSSTSGRFVLSRWMDWYGYHEAAEQERKLQLSLSLRNPHDPRRWIEYDDPWARRGYIHNEDILDAQLQCAAQAGEWRRFRRRAERRFAESMSCADDLYPRSVIHLGQRHTRSPIWAGGYAFTSPRDRIRFRSTVKVGRAGELLAAGKPADAILMAHQITAEMPLHVGNVIYLVQMFERAGRKAEADKLFANSNAAFLAVTKAMPGEWTLWSDWAWLASQCNRDLDDALVAARRAATLAPGIECWGVLAAVHIARKEHDKAALIQRMVGPYNAVDARQMGQIRTALRKKKP